MNKHYLSLLLAASAGLAAILTPITARAAATIYVSNAGNNTIEQFTEAGVGSVFASTGLNGPQGLAFDSAGNLYVANRGSNTIMKFTPGGTGSVFASTIGVGPGGLAFDSAGNLYAVTGGNSGPTIEKFTPGGTGSVFASGAFQTGLPLGQGLAFDSAGNLYVATGGSGGPVDIMRFTPGGVGSFFAQESPFFQYPTGMAFDSTGNLYAAMNSNLFGSTFIQKYTPAGGLGTTFAQSTYNPTFPDFNTFSYMGGLAFDSAGNLYAPNFFNNAVEKFTPGGVGTVFADAADGLSNPSFIAIRNNNVPEPSTWAMVAAGAAALLGFRRRSKAHA